MCQGTHNDVVVFTGMVVVIAFADVVVVVVAFADMVVVVLFAFGVKRSGNVFVRQRGVVIAAIGMSADATEIW